MPIVDYSVLEPAACPHQPQHRVWTSLDGLGKSVCQMTSTHIYNAVRRLEDGHAYGVHPDEVDQWVEDFETERTRRMRLRVERAGRGL